MNGDGAARWPAVASRILAAGLGGYALAYAATAALAAHLPIARADAASFPAMLAPLIHGGAILWAFAARSAAGAWLWLAGTAAACAAIAWLPALLR